MKNTKLFLLFVLAGLMSLSSCKKVEKEMLVTTGTVSNILIATADVTGNILDLGEGATEYGHCYSISPNTNISGTKTEYSSPAIGGFTSALTGLTPGTKYYIKAYLSRGSAVVYGSEINFTTASDALPELTTTIITAITKISAIGGGNITNQGGTPVTSKGVCWSLATITTLTNNKTIDGTGTGTFTSEINGLNPGTNYFVRAYATNSGGTKLGNEVTFTTNSDIPVQPTVTTADVTSVTDNSAACGGSVTNEGGSSVTIKGVCWSTSANPTPANYKTENGSGPGSYISNITGLDPGTKYYVRSYATNSSGTAYGTEYSFTTNAVIPTLSTLPVTSITGTTASSGGNITSEGGASIITKGVCWSNSVNPSLSDNKTSNGFGASSYVSLLSPLTPLTSYHVRAYATNSTGTGYGADILFTTIGVPSITTSAISSVTSTTAISGGNVTSDGGYAGTVHGVCWGTSSNPTTADAKTNDGIGSGTFTSSIIELAPGTTYHVRAYATNPAGTAYGADLSLTTLSMPAVTTSAISAITTSTATSGGSITSDGGSAVIARGVCWSTASNPTISDLKTIDGAGTGSFISSIAGLSPGTTYHVRAFAINSSGTGYGSDLQFTTNAVLPTVTTVSISEITSHTASSGGDVTYDGGAVITVHGVCWSINPNPTTGDSNSNDGIGVGAFTSSITGLTACTVYHVRAFATNSVGTAYGSDLTLTTGIVAPTVTTTTISSITSVSAVSGGTVIGECGSTVTLKGVCWSLNANPTTADPNTTNGSGSGSFASNISGLNYGTTYHVRAYATNSAGTSYGDDVTFVSSPILPVITTTAISSVSTTSAASGGNISDDGRGAVTARGVCWSTTLNPTTSNSKTNDATGSGPFSSSITGLNPGANYHVRAYATNAAGTAYGADVVFTTLGSAPTVTTVGVGNVTSSSIWLIGRVNANYLSTSVTIEYGPTTAYGTSVTPNQSPVTGNTDTNVWLVVAGLTGGATYHFRVKAVNALGTTYGSDVTFVYLYIGITYQGGIIFDIDFNGQHGLVCAPTDQSTGAEWGCYGTTVSGALGQDIGTGNQNTTDIITACTTVGIAARICYDLVLNGYSDWFLPSIGELAGMKYNLKNNGLGSFSNDTYWSSTTGSGYDAMGIYFFNSVVDYYLKNTLQSVRAVRAF